MKNILITGGTGFIGYHLAKKALNWEPKKKIEDMCVDGWKFKNHK